jgi:hypothetical protein
MAELMVAAGAWSAIELDGGGSSTTVTHLSRFKYRKGLTSASAPALTLVQVFEGRLVNHPTCIDKPFPQCERHVNSAVCILE